MAADVSACVAGRTSAELLAACLDGADEDRVQGWEEYVSAVTAAAVHETEALSIATDLVEQLRLAEARGDGLQESACINALRAYPASVLSTVSRSTGYDVTLILDNEEVQS